MLEQFQLIGITNKIAEVEGTENAFGYKGLHLDLRLNDVRSGMPEYVPFAPFQFELQIRTIVQDSWSALDHKIKYKKAIPPALKRRINTLAALFELADREFLQVRDATRAEIEKARAEDNAADAAVQDFASADSITDVERGQFAPLNAFRLLTIACHFFPDFEFAPQNVDGFANEIIERAPGISRGKFNFYLRENIALIHRYKDYFLAENLGDRFNAFTEMRHALYAGNSEVFASLLTNTARENFDKWRMAQPGTLRDERKRKASRRPLVRGVAAAPLD